jgi:hypothetical protein
MAKRSADAKGHDRSGIRQRVRRGIESGKEKYTARRRWGGWGSNPRAADYESRQPAGLLIAPDLQRHS